MTVNLLALRNHVADAAMALHEATSSGSAPAAMREVQRRMVTGEVGEHLAAGLQSVVPGESAVAGTVKRLLEQAQLTNPLHRPTPEGAQQPLQQALDALDGYLLSRAPELAAGARDAVRGALDELATARGYHGAIWARGAMTEQVRPLALHVENVAQPFSTTQMLATTLADHAGRIDNLGWLMMRLGRGADEYELVLRERLEHVHHLVDQLAESLGGAANSR